jgi:hypothetical protein
VKATWARWVAPAGMSEQFAYQKQDYRLRADRFLQVARNHRTGVGLTIALGVSMSVWALLYAVAYRLF